MIVAQINVTYGLGSTGVIVKDLSAAMDKNGIENYVFCVKSDEHSDKIIPYCSDAEIKINSLKSHLFGNYGFNAEFVTKRLVSKLKEINPDIIHLHNLHSHNINLKILFKYISESDIKLIWTFHDCWAFTGYCTHFDSINCDQWKSECRACPARKQFSFFFDKSNDLQRLKKDLLASVKTKTIVTPSRWLEGKIRASFLKDCDIKVINNGVDLKVFKPAKGTDRERYKGKKLILGIEKNNLNYFAELSKLLTDDFVLLLLSNDEKAKSLLSGNTEVMPYQSDKTTLAKLYSTADVFVNMTLEDTFPTVNIEALACGTPIVTFHTGGSPEIIDEYTGISVDKGDVSALWQALKGMRDKSWYSQKCLERAANLYDKNKRYDDYIDLYKQYIGGLKRCDK